MEERQVFDLSQLDPVTPDLYLIIHPAYKGYVPIRQPPRQVPGTVQPAIPFPC